MKNLVKQIQAKFAAAFNFIYGDLNILDVNCRFIEVGGVDALLVRFENSADYDKCLEWAPRGLVTYRVNDDYAQMTLVFTLEADYE